MQAVNLFETHGKRKIHIARDLGIADSTFGKECKEFSEHGEDTFLEKDHQIALEEESRRLRRENESLRQEREILKKSYEHLRVTSSVKYQFISDHRMLFPVLHMCHVLEVSENGYYNWRKRGKSQRKQEDEQLAERIEEVYRSNGGVYGSPRIHAELKAQGIHCARKRVARLMRERSLSARRTGAGEAST